jgi:hypothetical protein
MLPVNRVIAAASRCSKVAAACSSARRLCSVSIFRARTEASPGGFGDGPSERVFGFRDVHSLVKAFFLVRIGALGWRPPLIGVPLRLLGVPPQTDGSIERTRSSFDL